MSHLNKCLIITGELSGDQYAAELAYHLKKEKPSLTLYGVGGDSLQSIVDVFIENTASKSTSGFLETFKKRNQFMGFLSRLESFLTKTHIDRVIMIDFQHHNFKLGQLFNSFQIPVITFITPSFWIWKDLKKVKQLINYSYHVVPIFEKEHELYSQFSTKVSYFGHPLSNLVKKEIPPCLPPKPPYVIALFPGSRVHEISAHLPTMLESIILFKKRKGSPLKVYVSVSNPRFRALIQKIVKRHKKAEVSIVEGPPEALFKRAHLALNVPGTNTLKTMLYHVPQLMIGKTSWLTYIILKCFMPNKIQFIGLPNIIAGKEIVPELIQYEAEPNNIVKKMIPMFSISHRRWVYQQYLMTKKKLLKEQNPFEKITELILSGH